MKENAALPLGDPVSAILRFRWTTRVPPRARHTTPLCKRFSSTQILCHFPPASRYFSYGHGYNHDLSTHALDFCRFMLCGRIRARRALPPPPPS
jgi:hypothetical protein